MTDEKAPELLPCPFCGDPMEHIFDAIRHRKQGDCLIGQSAWTDLEAWNTRADRLAEAEARERKLREALTDIAEARTAHVYSDAPNAVQCMKDIARAALTDTAPEADDVLSTEYAWGDASAGDVRRRALERLDDLLRTPGPSGFTLASADDLREFRALIATPPARDDGPARLYVMQPRKNWHFDTPEGWTETHWERFDYVECAIFEKHGPLTEPDHAWLRAYGEVPDGWIEPTSWADRVRALSQQEGGE